MQKLFWSVLFNYVQDPSNEHAWHWNIRSQKENTSNMIKASEKGRELNSFVSRSNIKNLNADSRNWWATKQSPIGKYNSLTWISTIMNPR